MREEKHIKIISRGSPLLAMGGQTRKGACVGSVNVLKQCFGPQLVLEKQKIKKCKNVGKKSLCRSTRLKC